MTDWKHQYPGVELLVGNPALLFGAITGAMTSTAALMVITNQSKSTAPTLGYVGSYAFANVFLALAGGLIMRL